MARYRRRMPLALPVGIAVAVLFAVPQAREAISTIWQRITAEAGTAPNTYRVQSVADGDTLTVATDNGPQRVRVLGINAPEVAHDGLTAECGGPEAQRVARTELTGKRVTLITSPGTDNTDRYGRWLRYVELDGRDVGQTLIEQGWARPYTPRGAREPDRASPYRTAEARARTQRVGMWSACM